MSTKRNILAAALAAGIALPVGAYAQQGGFDDGNRGGPRQERGDKDWRDRDGRGGPGGWRHHGPRHGERRGPGMLWNVAEKLSAAEVALGITAEQEPAWRNFTGAVVAFVQAGRGGPMAQPPGDEDDGPEAAAPDAGPADEAAAPPAPDAADEADDQADAGVLDDLRGVQRMERFLDRSIARGQAAERVKTALDGLSAVLTPEQARTADRLLAELGPRHGPRHGPGRDGWGGPKGPRGPEGRGPEGRGPDNRGGETPPPPPPPAGEAPAPAQPQ